MKSCDVSEQIVESVSGNASCRIHIDSVKGLHNIRVVRNFKIRNLRLTESLNFYILAVIFSDRDGRIDDIGNDHHSLPDFLVHNLLTVFKLGNSLSRISNLCLDCHCFILFPLTHQLSDFLGNLIALSLKCFLLLKKFSSLFIKLDDFINHRKFSVLEFVADVLFYYFWIFSQKLNINHDFFLLILL